MQRRKFLNSIIWLTGGLLASCSKSLAAFQAPQKHIKGKVLAKGKGVANVVVSDGFSVVKTARDGSYHFPVAAQSRQVFVSIPSGYALPHQNYLARHYLPIETSGSELNFELEPLAVDDNKHQFIIWADPQVRNEKDVEKLMTQSVPDVQQYIKAQPAGALIHGIAVGDLVWDKHELFASYNEAVAQCGIPFFQVLGNHDMDYNKGGDDASDDTFKKTYGPTYYSFNRGQVHYVVLDDVWYLGSDRNYKGYISTEQLEWLKKDLSFVPVDKLIVLCLHIPVHNAVENRQALYDILKPYKVHIMSGHTHLNKNVVQENVYEHVHGTLCGAWWTGPVCEDGTPPGYGVYEVEGTQLTWHYKSVGYAKEHQLSTQVYTNEKGQKELLANVWNWDPQWNVEWWADGDYRGALQNVTTFDPVTVALYQGSELPQGRPFVEPKKTEHVFLVVVPDGVRQVKVVATDRFGNQYSSSLNV